MQIAIDGPAGVGKSTIAKKLAQELDYLYLDTGAMFRAATLIALENNIDLNNSLEIIKKLEENPFKQIKNCFYLGNRDVTTAIRERRVSQNVSKVATLKEIRDYFLNLQREIASENNIVMDGRDIATVVLPNANFKFFLTATPNTRAQRRAKELDIKDSKSLLTIEEEIKKRDQIDSTRKISPLKKASDAYLIETDELTIPEVLNQIKKIMSCYTF